MDDFTKRMLERTKARQNLLNSLVAEEANGNNVKTMDTTPVETHAKPGAVKLEKETDNVQNNIATEAAQHFEEVLEENQERAEKNQDEENAAEKRCKLLTERTRHFLQRLGALHSVSDADDTAAILSISSPVHPVHELVDISDNCGIKAMPYKLGAAEESKLAAAACKERTPGTGLAELAKLANQINEWQTQDIEDVDNLIKIKKSTEKDINCYKETTDDPGKTSTVTIKSSIKLTPNKDSRKVTFSSTPPISSPLKKSLLWNVETTPTRELSPEKSPLKKQQQPLSSASGSPMFKKQQSPAKSTIKEGSPFNRQQPQQQSLTIAQRRALYERNVVAGGGVPGALPSGLIKDGSKTKLCATSTSETMENQTPISVAAVAAKFDGKKKCVTPDFNDKKPAAPTPPRPSAISYLKQQRQHMTIDTPTAEAKQQYWSPPRVKNVLLKKQHQHEHTAMYLGTEDEVIPVVSSSPTLSNGVTKTPDTIVMTVGRVQCTPPGPGRLYPNVSMELKEDSEQVDMDQDGILINGVISKVASKRRSDGSVVNTSSSTNDTSLALVAAKKDEIEQSPLGLTTLGSPQYSSSFTYIGTQSKGSTVINDGSYFFTPPREDDQQEEQKPTPSLVHTISTYRKQQQQQRRLATKVKDTTGGFRESDEEEDPIQRTAAWTKKHALMVTGNYTDSDDDSDWELDAVAERARHLERKEVPQQESVIAQATQALNLCQTTRAFGNGSPEQVHAERLLLIAGLRRTDAVLEAQRLRVERTLRPFGSDMLTGKRPLNRQILLGSGKRLIIESLRVPVLAMPSGNHNSGKPKHNNQLLMNSGHRHYVCAVRTGATAWRPPLTVATRTVDAVEECVEWYATNSSDDAGYVEFIKKPNVQTKKGKETIGGPLKIDGLDDDVEAPTWKCTVEVYGLKNSGDVSSSMDEAVGEYSDTKSVLDKLWSSVMTTPTKSSSSSSKKHGHYAHHIESPGGPTAVRQTTFRLLGYFVFSAGQLDRRQFTLNRVYQQGVGSSTMANAAPPETVRVKMRLVDAEEDAREGHDDENDLEAATGIYSSSGGKLCLPIDAHQNRIEGFLTLFDDHELRRAQAKNKWHRSNADNRSALTAWRRLWFRMQVMQGTVDNDDTDTEDRNDKQKYTKQQTIVLTYWMYPEHAEQQRQPLGFIDLGRCLKPITTETVAKEQTDDRLPAEPAAGDLCARPNTLRLLVYGESVGNSSDDDQDEQLLLLAADTSAERREWCTSINAAVRAITEDHQKKARLERERQEKEQQKRDNERREREQQQQQQRIGGWPTPGKKKKKFYK